MKNFILDTISFFFYPKSVTILIDNKYCGLLIRNTFGFNYHARTLFKEEGIMGLMGAYRKHLSSRTNKREMIKLAQEYKIVYGNLSSAQKKELKEKVVLTNALRRSSTFSVASESHITRRV